MQVVSIQLATNGAERREDRFHKADSYLSALYQSGCRPQQIIFPELWATGFFAFQDYIPQAETDHGETCEFMSAWARKFGAYVHTGSFVEQDHGDYYNTSLLIAPSGLIVGKYRKIHLFSFQSRENEILSSGRQICVVKTEYGNVGLATCYDLRFPELFRTMLNLGAEYFLVSSAWPLSRIMHWRLFNQARAVENQCFLFSCNAAGTLEHQMGGNSMIVDPWGMILAQGDENEGVVEACADPNVLLENRKCFSALRDKKLI